MIVMPTSTDAALGTAQVLGQDETCWKTAVQLFRETFFARISTGMRRRFVLAMLFSLITSVLLVSSPLLFSSAIDILANSGEVADSLVLIVGSIVALGCAKLLAEQRWLVYQAAQNCFLNAIRSVYLQTVLSMPVSVHTNRSIGRLEAIVGHGMVGLQSMLSTIFTQFVPIIFEYIATLAVVVVVLSYKIAFVLCITIIMHFTILVIGAERVGRRFRAALNASIAAQGQAGDAILNVEGIKTLDAEEAVVRRYDQALEISHAKFLRFFRSRGVFGLLLSGVLVSGFGLSIGMTWSWVVDGHLSVGALVLTNAYLLQLFRSIESFSFSYRDARQSFTAVVRFVSLFAEPRDDDGGRLPIPDRIGAISVDQVGFVYPDGRRALENVSLTVERGRITALLGESGSGKSTLVRLLLKLYPLREGSITIDGIPVSNFDTRALRRQMAIVPQDAVMFKASLAFNVALTDEPDPERLKESLRSARLSALIERLPAGVETEIGERGFKLSGGERQRVAIARALYRNPQILVLDEATSALDETTRDEVLATIGKLGCNYATLIVTHDPSVAAIAHRVVTIAPPAEKKQEAKTARVAER